MYTAALILTLITPLSMMILGLLWKRKIPSRDQIFSYRSELALKNEETWEFAHSHIRDLWVRVGFITLVLTLILMRVFADSYTLFVLWLLMGQMVFFCGCVFFVDSIMKAVFDKDGNRTIF